MKSIKICLAGPYASGKTTYLNKVRDKSDDVKTTISTTYETFKYDGVSIQFYDTAGQEQYAKLIQPYLRQANVVFLITDASDSSNDQRSIDIRDSLPKNVEVVNIMNKIDLVDEYNMQSVENRAKKIAPNAPFFLISALHGTNIFVPLSEGVKLGLKNLENNQDESSPFTNSSSSNKNGCC